MDGEPSIISETGRDVVENNELDVEDVVPDIVEEPNTERLGLTESSSCFSSSTNRQEKGRPSKMETKAKGISSIKGRRTYQCPFVQLLNKAQYDTGRLPARPYGPLLMTGSNGSFITGFPLERLKSKEMATSLPKWLNEVWMLMRFRFRLLRVTLTENSN
ncbi:hypothetical protein LIER_37975 [Lithospermum erythrorhizon]|uniref:Uncharacterized protein n=1 Tax=Lithospermum erythrorhizon TaxID=34254 RepID=A0AAV3PUV4_LITER